MMRFADDQTDSDVLTLDDAAVDSRRIINQKRLPLPPKQFRVQKAQNGIRFFAADRAKLATEDGRLSSSVRYRVRWAEQANLTDTDKIEAAFRRSTIIATIEGTGKEGVEASVYVVDPMYGSGYYFCTGVDGDGEEGTEYSQPVSVTSQILDDSIPSDPTHVQVSESGTAHNDVVYSEISVSCRAPNPLTSFNGVQLFLRHYQELNLVQEGYFHPYTGVAGGSLNFKVVYPVCRRKGSATISATNGNTAVTGSGFLTQARAGDLIEVLGVRGTIQSVNSDTSITLTANWSGRTVAAFTDYNIIGKVDVFVVAISKGNTHRFDWQNAPMVSVVFDGDLSAPNAPTIAATAQGNGIRIDITPVIGTKIDRYIIYRGTGAGVAFSSCSPIWPLPADTNNATGLLQWVDTKFTAYEKEQAQTFSYYVTAVNVGDQESAASTRAEASCRLDSDQDTDPIQARDGFKNYLFNGFIGGDGVTIGGVNNVVDDSDTTQDNFNFDPPIAAQTLANIGVGASALRAWTRWKYEQRNQTTVYPTHVNGNEVKLPAPGAAAVSTITNATNASPIVITTSAAHGRATGDTVTINGVLGNTAANSAPGAVWTITVVDATHFSLNGSTGNGAYTSGGTSTANKDVRINEYILAYNDADQKDRKIAKGEYFTLQGEAYSDGSPNGSLVLGIAQYNVGGGTSQWAFLRTRNSDDTFSESIANAKIFPATQVIGTAGRFYAVFRLDPSFTTDKIAVTFFHLDSAAGNIYVRKVMLSPGIKIPPWTGDMGEVTSSTPVANNPPPQAPDPDGNERGGRIVV